MKLGHPSRGLPSLGTVKLRESSLPALISTSSLPTLGGWKLQIETLMQLSHTLRQKRSRFCHIFLVQSLVWKYCLKLEGCLHNFFLIGPHSAAAEPNSAPKIVTQFLEPSLVLRRRFCLNVRILRMPLNLRNHRCKYSPHSWSLVLRLLISRLLTVLTLV